MLIAFGIVLLLRYPISMALTVAGGLAQIGEFSFILAGLGVSLGLLPHEGQDLILAAAILSITLNPLVFFATDGLKKYVHSKWPSLWANYGKSRQKALGKELEKSGRSAKSASASIN